jgi:hypothetical protein
MTRIIVTAALSGVVLAFAVGCSGSGAQEAGPVPTAQGSQQSTATLRTHHSTSTASPTASTSPTPRLPLCKDKAATVRVASQQGAAGTIMTTWRVTNTSSGTCRSSGYPGMDFHASIGWLGVEVQRGGYPSIDSAPASVVLGPGESLYVASYWSDVDTGGGLCTPFDHVKVTLPDNFTSARLAATGCVDPPSVDVGPVTESRPS